MSELQKTIEKAQEEGKGKMLVKADIPRGMITDSQLFRGREKELGRIFEGLRGEYGMVNFSIVGERGMGKSSLLYHLCQSGPEQIGDSYNFFYIDLQRVSSEDDFCRHLCKIMGVNPADNPLWALNDHFDDLAPDQKVVLCIDEFDKASRFSRDFQDWLRSISQLPNVALIIASRKPVSEIVPHDKTTSPLAGVLIRIDLKPVKES